MNPKPKNPMDAWLDKHSNWIGAFMGATLLCRLVTGLDWFWGMVVVGALWIAVVGLMRTSVYQRWRAPSKEERLIRELIRKFGLHVGVGFIGRTDHYIYYRAEENYLDVAERIEHLRQILDRDVRFEPHHIGGTMLKVERKL